jgi:hypothetical protein
MTKPTDKIARIKKDGSSDKSIIDPTKERGHWNGFSI